MVFNFYFNSLKGIHIHQGVMIYVNKINSLGGVNGQRIVLDVYDDKNDEQIAQQKAREILKDNRAVAVIGHIKSSNSIAAGKIYEENQIPAVTPSSSNINVTKNNEWYFSTVTNDYRKGRLLQYYISHVLQSKRISIIHATDTYSLYLVQVLTKAAAENGSIVNNIWSIEPDDQNFDTPIKQVVSDLKRSRNLGVLVLLTQTGEGVQLVKAIKDAGLTNMIIGGESYAGSEFRSGFGSYEAEKRNQVIIPMGSTLSRQCCLI